MTMSTTTVSTSASDVARVGATITSGLRSGSVGAVARGSSHRPGPPRDDELEHPPRLGVVDARQGEAHVDHHVIVGADLRDVLQADPLEHPAELDLAHEHVVLAVGLHYLAGNPEA